MSEEKKEKEKSAEPTEELKETGSANLEGSRDNHRIKLLTIVGEIEGHEAVSGNTKATKYDLQYPWCLAAVIRSADHWQCRPTIHLSCQAEQW